MVLTNSITALLYLLLPPLSLYHNYYYFSFSFTFTIIFTLFLVTERGGGEFCILGKRGKVEIRTKKRQDNGYGAEIDDQHRSIVHEIK